MTSPYGSLPPHTDRDTSKEAAQLMVEHAPNLREKVYRYLLSRDDGATDHEIRDDLSMKHSTVNARRRELVLEERVFDSGKRRKTGSGGTAIVWTAVGTGEQVPSEQVDRRDLLRGQIKQELRALDVEQLESVVAFVDTLS